ncbi:hypothetical protein Q0Z83_044990 [Actinoplanes sichuanensis]|uniref:Uncharacterized protein n=2 Tax=Actinoplanes sichuanensis TaxID=512349 RepID=A0ABW4AS40_9ACTN|nr:hypothetical protein [Actinoplanes sichuanensis]BEL06308.1 hypothetical protein Q0Z83_044990 [Actinoplanes sichuanensis]
MSITPAGIGPALLNGAVAPLVTAGLFSKGDAAMCDTTLSGSGALADVAAYTDPGGTIVEQLWIHSPKLTTRTGVHVGSSEAELKKAYGSALRLFQAKENPYVRAYFLDEGGNSVVFLVPDGGDGIDKILVMSTALGEASVRNLEGFC